MHLQQSQHYESSVWVTFEWFRKLNPWVWFNGCKVPAVARISTARLQLMKVVIINIKTEEQIIILKKKHRQIKWKFLSTVPYITVIRLWSAAASDLTVSLAFVVVITTVNPSLVICRQHFKQLGASGGNSLMMCPWKQGKGSHVSYHSTQGKPSVQFCRDFEMMSKRINISERSPPCVFPH